MLDSLDAGAVRGWCRSAADALNRARSEIDALNVFPVPDSDTGTNLHLTMEAVAEAAETGGSAGDDGDRDAELVRTWQAIARGALIGARGNSGVIVSQLWRGLAEVLPGAVPCRGRALSEGLRRASSLAYDAVGRPVEGTVLTVARAASDASAKLGTDDLATVARAAAEGARGALTMTTGQLDALTRAGVVDAGGAGLCVILDSLVGVVSGRRTETPLPPVARRTAADIRSPGTSLRETAGPGYEVMYLLDAEDGAIPRLRAELAELGDCLLVVGGESLWNVHVHTEDAGAAIEAGLAAGRPHRIRVNYLHVDAGLSGPVRTVLASAPEGGESALAALLTEAGATVLGARPGAGAGLDVDAIHEATRRAGHEVVLLPTRPDIHSVMEAAAARGRDDGVHVSVLPARATVQAIAALAVHDPQRRFDDDVVAMTAAATATRFGEVLVAAGAAVTSAGICAAGDVLGLIDGDVVLIGAEPGGVAIEVADRMLATGGELVTLVTGSVVAGAAPSRADCSAGGEDGTAGATDLAGAVVAHLRRFRPDLDTTVYAGGRLEAALLIGVE